MGKVIYNFIDIFIDYYVAFIYINVSLIHRGLLGFMCTFPLLIIIIKNCCKKDRSFLETGLDLIGYYQVFYPEKQDAVLTERFILLMIENVGTLTIYIMLFKTQGTNIN